MKIYANNLCHNEPAPSPLTSDLFHDGQLSSGHRQIAHKFRGVNILNVGEPAEPSDIVWSNVEAQPHNRYHAAKKYVILWRC